jgi:hypothetical protein
MKARDIRAALQGKVDPSLVHCLCAVAETVSAQQQEIMALAKIQDTCIDVIQKLGITTEAAVDKVKKLREPDA